MSAMGLDIGRIAKLLRDSQGVAAVEFAIILPVMLIMYFGTFEASSLVRAYLATNRAAQLIANLVAQEGPNGLSPTDSTDFCTAGQLAMAPFPVGSSKFKATISSVTNKASSGTVAFDWNSPDTTCGGGAGVFSTATIAADQLVPNKGDSVIIVKVQYSYTGAIHFVLPAGFTIIQTAYQRPRTGSSIPHT